MTALCLDTSAVFKTLIEEPGSEKLRARLAAEDVAQVVVSVLVGPEIAGVLARRARDGSLDPAARDALVDGWRRSLRHLDEVPVPGGGEVVREAERVALVHGLRGMDAVHVATAVVLSRGLRGSPVVFLTADVRQAAAGRAESLEVDILS